MTDDDLVRRLLVGACAQNDVAWSLMRAAADRIKALTAEHNATLARLAGAVAREIALTAERDDALECNEQFFVYNQFLKKRVEKAEAEWRRYESAWMTAEGKLEDAVQGLEKCQAELDEYSRQEYPLDHSVHERYRQRDYDANPARITLAALKGQSHD